MLYYITQGGIHMSTMFPKISERLETPRVICSILYSILAFWSLPFILLLLMQGSFEDMRVLAGVESAYHIANFGVAAYLFFPYLQDSLINVEINVKGFWTVVCTCAAIAVCVGVFLWFCCMYIPHGVAIMAAESVLPLVEKELFTTAGNFLGISPILGTICMVILTPVSISCLFYGTVFAPVATKYPKLAYLVVTVFLAIPSLCNAITYWDPTIEMATYFVQLPIHLLACWSYQKTDTIWAPIGVHGLSNAVSCAIWLVLIYLV